MSKAKVDIIIPVFNAEKTIANALDSIRNQSFSSWECIIVNDGSTDNTSAIISGYQEKDSRFKIINIDHSGIVKALNSALENTTADFIARMDSDDISFSKRLEKQVDFLLNNQNIDAVSCLVEHNASDPNQKGFANYVDWTNQIITPEEHFTNRFIESPVVHPTVMFRKNLIEKYGIYSDSQNWPEDYELWLRWMQSGVKFSKIPEKLFLWNDRTDRLSRTHKSCNIESFYNCKTYYLANGPLEEIKKIGIWGAGKLSRKHSNLLTEYGKEIIFYVDVDPKKIGNIINEIPIISLNDLSKMPDVPLISYVGNRGARNKIRKVLQGSRYKEGKNFWCAS